MTQILQKSIGGIALLKSIGDKNNMEKAKESLALFTAFFEDKISRKRRHQGHGRDAGQRSARHCRRLRPVRGRAEWRTGHLFRPIRRRGQ